ncbi:MAG: flagellar basal body P-ring protein FlgI [Candidatus Cloacimonadota bacterium]|nr:flagellar basal body P-ring protein FlgI [Candidatus Cloacimonadota bacterium]
MKKRIGIFVILNIYLLLVAGVRIKDVCYFNGLETKQLIGHGLVIGLDGTGDGSSSQMTVQAIKNMMERFGITIPMNKIRPKNVASVIVTAQLPPYAKLGNKIDLTVSSVGDAKSLEGGTLLMTQLIGGNGEIYADGQGPISIGGFNSTISKSKTRKNFTNVGRIPGGAIVRKEELSQILYNGELLLNLQNPDFTFSQIISEAINAKMDMKLSIPEDATSIKITVPERMVDEYLIEFISIIEGIEVQPVINARVVINERTGTIVAGGNVTISEVAVSHGNLIIKIKSVKMEAGIGDASAEVTYSEEDIKEEPARVMVMKSSTVQELAMALNSIKVTPRDLISIFQSLKVAGALQAELIIM